MTSEQRELAEANQGLAWMVAHRFHRREQGEDARQELGAIALLALCEAARGFDEDLGYAFSTYATIACTQAIQEEKRSGGLIHVPIYLSRRGEAGHRYQVHREHVHKATHSPVLLASLTDPAASPLEQAKAIELRDRVRKLPGKLRYAMERSIEGWTNAEIGREMGFSNQYACDLIRMARARLRKMVKT